MFARRWRRMPVVVRFTALFGAVLLLSGVALLGLTNVVAVTSVRHSVSAPVNGEPHPDNDAQEQIAELQRQLDEARNGATRELLIASLIALAVLTVAAGVLGRLVAGRTLRPLRAITAATRRITADNLHERLAVDGPADEVKDLADTIDGLLERLDASFAAQRRFVANASHELRTPLATMRASLDVALAKPEPAPPQTVLLADRLRTELDQVDRLLAGLLTLARAQQAADAVGDVGPVQLDALVREALAEHRVRIARRRLTVDVRGSASTRGSRTLLARAVGNVVDNAVLHNVDGGWIRVRVTGPATLTVENGGPRLEPDQVAGLGEPFQRLGAARTGGAADGTGLGLSIVAAIAAAHSGRLGLRAPAGGGLVATLVLPGTDGTPVDVDTNDVQHGDVEQPRTVGKRNGGTPENAITDDVEEPTTARKRDGGGPAGNGGNPDDGGSAGNGGKRDDGGEPP